MKLFDQFLLWLVKGMCPPTHHVAANPPKGPRKKSTGVTKSEFLDLQLRAHGLKEDDR